MTDQPQAVPDLVEELRSIVARIEKAKQGIGPGFFVLVNLKPHEWDLILTNLSAQATLERPDLAEFAIALQDQLTAAKADVAQVSAARDILGKMLAEEMASLIVAESERDAALAELERMRKPVTDEETAKAVRQLEGLSANQIRFTDEQRKRMLHAADLLSRLSSRAEAAERANAAAQAIFDKRAGAYGTALIERGPVLLSQDLETLRAALQPKPQRP